MTKKASKAAKKALNVKLAALVNGAADIGYNVSGAFEGGVTLARSLAKSKIALDAAGRQYKAGYIVRNLEAEPTIAKRWGNMPLAQRIDAALSIMDKPTPDSTKPGRRTEREHKAVRAADVSWAGCKRRAGIGATKAGNASKRKPRPSANAPTVKVDLVKASPRFTKDMAKQQGKDTVREVANDYFATSAAALLATVNKNALIVSPALSSAVADFKAAVDAALKA
jgi:hypothetical protein